MKRLVLPAAAALLLFASAPASAQDASPNPAGWSAALEFADAAYVARSEEAMEEWLVEELEGFDRERMIRDITDLSMQIELRGVFIRDGDDDTTSLTEAIAAVLGEGSGRAERLQRRMSELFLVAGSDDVILIVTVDASVDGESQTVALGHLLRETKDGWRVVRVADN